MSNFSTACVNLLVEVDIGTAIENAIGHADPIGEQGTPGVPLGEDEEMSISIETSDSIGLLLPCITEKAWDEYEDIYIYQEFFLEEQDAYDKNILRGKRYNLLLAFDKWEKAVLRGRGEDSAIVMNWYQQLLDLNAKAFEEESIPSEIQYYLK